MDDFIDFSNETRWHELFYSRPAIDNPLLKELNAWLRGYKNDFVRLYHGTSKAILL